MQRLVRRPPVPAIASLVVRPLRVTLGLLALGLALAGFGSGVLARAQSTADLERTIAGKRADEQRARKAIKKLAALEDRIGREVAIVQRKLDIVEASYEAARAELEQTQQDLAGQQRRGERLRTQLAAGRATLAAQLKRSYMTSRADLTTIVLTAGGINEVLNQLEFERRVQRANAHILDVVRRAKVDARAEAARLARLERRRARTTTAIGRQRAGIGQIRAALAARQAELSQARAVRQAALKRSKGSRARAERTLKKLEAERNTGFSGAVDRRGPGGPWAIPWPIVQCESGGQNLPPNSAGASGYYQFMPQTWKALGGSTPNAYQASKAEQDRLAAKLWRGGAGRSNWVCAALVGA